MGLYIINAGEIILLRPIPRWLSGQIMCLQCRRHGFNPWVRKIPWRSKWQSTPVFLLENPMDRRPGRLQSMGSERVIHD